MSQEAIRGQITAALVTADDEKNRQATLGLLMTAGVANRFRKGDITEEEARRQINTIVGSGQIADPIALKQVVEAFESSTILREDPRFAAVLDTGFKLAGSAAPFFTPAGGVVVSVVSEFGARFVRYLNDPNNILTGQFAPPRPDDIALAGAVAFEQMNKIVGGNSDLTQIYRELFPDPSRRIGLGESDDEFNIRIDEGFSPEVSTAIRGVLKAGAEEQQKALDNLQEKILQRMDAFEETAGQVLSIAKNQQEEAERVRLLEQIRQREQRIQAETTGAITVLDTFIRSVLGDKRAADITTGTLRTAQSTYQLVSGFAAGTIGILGLAGGIATVFTGFVGLFGGGSDATTQRLEEIDRKLDRITEVLEKGLEHLDKRLTDLLEVSQQIVRQVAFGDAVLQAQIGALREQIDLLTKQVEAGFRGEFEAQLGGLAEKLQATVENGEPLEGLAVEILGSLENHIQDISRRSELNGRRSIGTTLNEVAAALGRTDDIRSIIGNLPFVASLSGVAVADNNPPNPKHWSRSARGVVEFLLLAPETKDGLAASKLERVWLDGTALKASVLAATNSDLLSSLIDRYEAQAIRARSTSAVEQTLDEFVEGILGADIALAGNAISKALENLIRVSPQPSLFQIGAQLKFLGSILAWRVSDINDDITINPRSLDIIGDGDDLVAFLIGLLVEESKKDDPVTEANGTAVHLTAQVRDSLMQSFQGRLKDDIDRLRASIAGIAQSRRVRDVDEVLLAVHALADSRKSPKLPEVDAPLLRIPPRRQPKSIYEVDEQSFKEAVVALCKDAGNDFVASAGESIETSTGLRKLANPPLGFIGEMIPTGAPGNPNGRQTYVRLFLTEPLNFRQGTDHAVRYMRELLKTFPAIDALDIQLPGYVRRTDSAITIRTSHHYLTRALGPDDPPSELALVTREVRDGKHSRFANELWIFTRRSGAIIHDVETRDRDLDGAKES